MRLTILILLTQSLTLFASETTTTIFISKNKAIYIQDSELTSSPGVDCIAFFDLSGVHSQSITDFVDRSGGYDDERMILAWDRETLSIIDTVDKRVIGRIFLGEGVSLVGHLHLNPSKKKFMRISYRIKNSKIFSSQTNSNSATIRRTLKYKNGLYKHRHPLKLNGKSI